MAESAGGLCFESFADALLERLLESNLSIDHRRSRATAVVTQPTEKKVKSVGLLFYAIVGLREVVGAKFILLHGVREGLKVHYGDRYFVDGF